MLGNSSRLSHSRLGSTISFSTLTCEAWSTCPNTPNNWEDSFTSSCWSFLRPEAMAIGKRLFNLLHPVISSRHKLGKHEDWRSLPENTWSFSSSLSLAMIYSNSSQFDISRNSSWSRLAIMLFTTTLSSFTDGLIPSVTAMKSVGDNNTDGLTDGNRPSV